MFIYLANRLIVSSAIESAKKVTGGDTRAIASERVEAIRCLNITEQMMLNILQTVLLWKKSFVNWNGSSHFVYV